MIKLVVGACVTICMSVAAMPALAQGTSLQRAACTSDVFRHCSGDIPNVDRITACLRREKAKLSTGCQNVFNALDQTRVATRSIESPAGTGTAWCASGDPSATGQEIWTAWCRSSSVAQ